MEALNIKNLEDGNKDVGERNKERQDKEVCNEARQNKEVSNEAK